MTDSLVYSYVFFSSSLFPNLSLARSMFERHTFLQISFIIGLIFLVSRLVWFRLLLFFNLSLACSATALRNKSVSL